MSSHQELAREYAIRAVPTFIYTRDGSEVRRKTGRVTEKQLIKLCRDTWY